MKRLVIVYNPRSSKHSLIEKEVLEPARSLKGYTVGRFEVKKMPVDENAKRLAKLLNDGDLVVAAGGDGTATVAVNAVMLAQKPKIIGSKEDDSVKFLEQLEKPVNNVALGVIGYGNFNDMARMLGQKKLLEIVKDFESGDTERLFPLEAVVDGAHYRYAGCYFTIGMFSESTEVFDAPKTRATLKKGRRSLVFSVATLAKWYFKNRKREFLPGDVRMNELPLNRKKVRRNGKVNDFRGRHVSDIMFVNSKTVAKVMRGGDYWMNPEEYYVVFGRLKGLFRLAAFMAKSMIAKLPGHRVDGETKIDFSAPAEVEIQAEGEYKRIKIKELVIKKADNSITVVV